MTNPFDDLLGIEPAAVPPSRRRSANTEAAADAAARLQEQLNLKSAVAGRAFNDVGGLQAFRRPVTINFLAQVFEHDVQTVTKRLIECPHRVESGRKLYDFKEACSYIVKPRMTVEQLIKTLNSSHLPPEVNKAFWDGQRSRVKYKIEAQEAWETHDVNAALGKLCMTVKECLSTMTESMRERARLTDEQAILFDEAIEDLRNRLAENLEELATRTDSASLYGKPLYGAPGNLGASPPAYIDDDEDAE